MAGIYTLLTFVGLHAKGEVVTVTEEHIKAGMIEVERLLHLKAMRPATPEEAEHATPFGTPAGPVLLSIPVVQPVADEAPAGGEGQPHIEVDSNSDEAAQAKTGATSTNKTRASKAKKAAADAAAPEVTETPSE